MVFCPLLRPSSLTTLPPCPTPLTQVRAQRQRAGRLRCALPHDVQVLAGVKHQQPLALQECRHIMLWLRLLPCCSAARLQQRRARLRVKGGPQRPALVPVR